MLVDLHVHTKRTPGCDLEVREAAARAQRLGLDGICFTDLERLDGVEEIHALRGEVEVALFVGMIAESDHGRFLCFFPDPAGVDVGVILGEGPPHARRASELVDAVLAVGGAAVASAPYDRELERPMGDFLLTLRQLTAVEGFVGTQRINVNELAIESASHLALPCVGGSGAIASYEEIGKAATLFRDEVRDEAELVAALREGAVWPAVIGERLRFHGDDRLPRRESGDLGEDRRGRRGGRRGGGRRRGPERSS